MPTDTTAPVPTKVPQKKREPRPMSERVNPPGKASYCKHCKKTGHPRHHRQTCRRMNGRAQG